MLECSGGEGDFGAMREGGNGGVFREDLQGISGVEWGRVERNHGNSLSPSEEQ